MQKGNLKVMKSKTKNQRNFNKLMFLLLAKTLKVIENYIT